MADNPIRTSRLMRGGRIFMVPLDHGISMGPGPLPRPAEIVARVAGQATCVTLHKGLVDVAAPYADRLGILLHLSASTDLGPDPDDKRVVASVAEALRMGCDGVSTHINLGSATEARQLAEVGAVGAACQEWGMPHIAMVYPRGPKVKDPRDPALVAHAARLGAELGADAVKVPYTDAATFRDVVAGAGIPVIVAGGAKADPAKLVGDLHDAAAAGAAGVSIGRNVFQAPDPAQALHDIIQAFGTA